MPRKDLPAGDVIEGIAEAVRRSCLQSGLEIGFVIGLVGPPFRREDGTLHQEFRMASNAGEVGSVVGIMGRMLEGVARTEADKRIIGPEGVLN